MTRLLIQPRTSRRLRRIGPDSAGSLMTPEEFDALRPEEFVRGNRYELINGVLIVSPQPGISERDPNEELGYLLRLYRDTHPEGKTLDDTVTEQTVPATNRRRADRVIWADLGRMPDEEKDIPSIVVEFVSSRKRDSIRDYEAKRDEYLKAGVREYWIIDRFRRVMMVYYPGLIGPTSTIVTETQDYRTDLLPGFVLPLSRLFSRADRWKPKRKSSPKRKSKPADAPPETGQAPPAGGRETDG